MKPSVASAATSSSSGNGGSRSRLLLRRDFVLNLDTLLQREVDSTTSPYTTNNTVERDGDNSGSSSGRQVLLASDRHSIRTYPLRVIDQLQICYFETKPSLDAPTCFKTMRVYGFECIHCNKLRKSSSSSTSVVIRQKKRGFRKYPKHHANDVARALIDFRSHLNVCSRVSSDLVSYLNWMEQWCRFPKVVESVAKSISHRLDGLRKRGYHHVPALSAPAPPMLLLPSLSSPQKRKRKTIGENSGIVLLTKTKRSARGRSHSVLENVNSLA